MLFNNLYQLLHGRVRKFNLPPKTIFSGGNKILVLDYKQILISSVRSLNTLYHLFIQENSGSVYTILHILNPLAYHMFITKSEQQNISVAESFYNLSLNFTAF